MASPPSPAKSPIYLFAFVHIFSIDVFFLLCAYGIFPLDSSNPIVDLSFNDTSVFANDTGLFMFRFLFVALLVLAVGYYRLYADGPSSHPVVLASGGLAKAWVAHALTKGYLDGYLGILMVICGVVDGTLSVLYLRDWSRLDYTLTPTIPAKND